MIILGGTGKLWLLICLKSHSTEFCALRLRADEIDDIFTYLFILSFIYPSIQKLFMEGITCTRHDRLIFHDRK